VTDIAIDREAVRTTDQSATLARTIRARLERVKWRRAGFWLLIVGIAIFLLFR